MTGLLRYGAYVPFNRLRRSEIKSPSGGGGRGTKSVASYDEDTTSMGVEAARLALRDSMVSPQRIIFVTSNPPYVDKTNATTIHAALGLDRSALAVDAVGSVRSGAGAILSALEASVPTLVVLSDVRNGLVGSADEMDGGDAACALLFGAGETSMELISHASVSAEFLDRWRIPGASSSRLWEERFGEQIYRSLGEEAFGDALKLGGLVADNVDHLVVAGTHIRANKSFAASSGVNASVANDHQNEIGNVGAAAPGLLLTSVLDIAEPNQVIALVVLADGASVFLFRTTDAVRNLRSNSTVEMQIQNGRDKIEYTTYLSWKGQLATEPPRRPDPSQASAPPSFRSGSYKFAFQGSRCLACGTVHLPPDRVCISCGSVDQMEPHPLANAVGTVVTFTIDRLAFTPSPPMIAAIVDFDGGGRFKCQLTDCDPDQVSIGDRVELTFRRLYTVNGIHNYFWKAKPVRASKQDAEEDE